MGIDAKLTLPLIPARGLGTAKMSGMAPRGLLCGARLYERFCARLNAGRANIFRLRNTHLWQSDCTGRRNARATAPE
ncbi:MAG: hypothetical protein AAFY35_17040 [Pseudomonadota bacterium]